MTIPRRADMLPRQRLGVSHPQRLGFRQDVPRHRQFLKPRRLKAQTLVRCSVKRALNHLPRATVLPESVVVVGAEDAAQEDRLQTEGCRRSGGDGKLGKSVSGLAPMLSESAGGQGSRRLMRFVAAWDALSSRLSQDISDSDAAKMVLAALKLLVQVASQEEEGGEGVTGTGGGPEGEKAKLERLLAAGGSPGQGAAGPSGLDRRGVVLQEGLDVALILADLNMDAEVIAAGLLRGIIDVEGVAQGRGLGGLAQGHEVTLECVKERLGNPGVHRLLQDTQSLQKLPHRLGSLLDDETSDAARQFCLAFHDHRALLIELAAHLCHMRQLGDQLALSPRGRGARSSRLQLKALEVLALWAPLAHSLGVGPAMWELEDTACRVLFPRSYGSLQGWLWGRWGPQRNGEQIVAYLQERLQGALEADEELGRLAARVEVKGRFKSLHSVVKKILKDGRLRDDIHDLLGMRVIVHPHPHRAPSAPAGSTSSPSSSHSSAANSAPAHTMSGDEREASGEAACYRVAELVTSLWEELPQRRKDYIARPKKNGYRSLHLAVSAATPQAVVLPSDPRDTEEGSLGRRIGTGVDEAEIRDERATVEVQVRTVAMEVHANEGEAAHGLYKGRIAASSGTVLAEQMDPLLDFMRSMSATIAKLNVRPTTATSPVAGDRAEPQQRRSTRGRGLRAEAAVVPVAGTAVYDVTLDVEARAEVAQMALPAPAKTEGLSNVGGQEPEGGPTKDAAAVASVAAGDERALEEVFRMLDRNGDGVISLEELRGLMEELGASADEEWEGDGAGAMAAAGTWASGVGVGAAPGSGGVLDVFAEGGKGLRSLEQEARQLLSVLDANTDGTIDLEEFGEFRRQVRLLDVLRERDLEFEGDLQQAEAEVEAEEREREREKEKEGRRPLLLTSTPDKEQAKAQSGAQSGSRQLYITDSTDATNMQQGASAPALADRNPGGEEEVAVTGAQGAGREEEGGAAWVENLRTADWNGAVLAASAAPKSAPRPSTRGEQDLAAAKGASAGAHVGSSVVSSGRFKASSPAGLPAMPALAARHLNLKNPPSRGGGLTAAVEMGWVMDTRRAAVAAAAQRGGSGVTVTSLRSPGSRIVASQGQGAGAGAGAGPERRPGTAPGHVAAPAPLSKPRARPGAPGVTSAGATSAVLARGAPVVEEGMEGPESWRTNSPKRGAGGQGEGSGAGGNGRGKGWAKSRGTGGVALGGGGKGRGQAKGPTLEERLAGIRRKMADKSEASLREARAMLEEVQKSHPEEPNVWVHLAQLERKAGNVADARQLYETACKMFEARGIPDMVQVRALQAWGTLEGKEGGLPQLARRLFEKSLECAKQLERRTGQSASAGQVVGLHAWAMMERREGNWAAARTLLEVAQRVSPGNAIVLQSRAMLEAEVHHWAEARLFFKAATEADPSDVSCWQAWALFEAKRGNRSRMRKLFARALAAKPDSTYTFQAWAKEEAKVGTTDSLKLARGLFRCCTKVDPNCLHAWQAWAVMEHRQGRYEEARRLFEECLAVAPASVHCLQAYAVMERSLGNEKKAKDLLALALAAQPMNAPTLMTAAQMEQASGSPIVAGDLYVRKGLALRVKTRRKKRMFVSANAWRESQQQQQEQQQKEKGLRDEAQNEGSVQAPGLAKTGTGQAQGQGLSARRPGAAPPASPPKQRPAQAPKPSLESAQASVGGVLATGRAGEGSGSGSEAPCVRVRKPKARQGGGNQGKKGASGAPPRERPLGMGSSWRGLA